MYTNPEKALTRSTEQVVMKYTPKSLSRSTEQVSLANESRHEDTNIFKKNYISISLFV